MADNLRSRLMDLSLDSDHALLRLCANVPVRAQTPRRNRGESYKSRAGAGKGSFFFTQPIRPTLSATTRILLTILACPSPGPTPLDTVTLPNRAHRVPPDALDRDPSPCPPPGSLLPGTRPAARPKRAIRCRCARRDRPGPHRPRSRSSCRCPGRTPVPRRSSRSRPNSPGRGSAAAAA